VDTAEISTEALNAIDAAGRLTPFSQRVAGFDLAEAYRAAASLNGRRIARGERPVGRKIGFTNRTIWDEYRVFAPIWGYIYDTTLFELAETSRVDLSKFAEPRIEPEIAFGFARAPEADMNERQILDCIDWAAHGFEIVQSHFPDWKFAAADTVADGGLHGAYYVGEKMPVARDPATWFTALSDFEIELFCDDKLVDRGHARNVLDGPLSALKHLVELLAQDGDGAPLVAGEIVTTGTVTKAFPIATGQLWRTALHRLPMKGIELRLER
jgi:2-oxo-3-hexenedioate decarboxylase